MSDATKPHPPQCQAAEHGERRFTPAKTVARNDTGHRVALSMAVVHPLGFCTTVFGALLPLALLALAIGAFSIGTTEFVAMGILPDVAQTFGVSIPSAGHMISGYAIGVVIGVPLLTAAGNRIDRKRMLLALTAVFTAGNLASALAPSFEFLLASRVLTALPHGTFFGTGAIVAASLVPVTKRARAISLMLVGLSVANVIGVPAATFAAQTLGWRSTFLLIAGFGALTLFALARLLPDQQTRAETSMRSELSALARGQVWLALAIGAVGCGGMFATYSYISPIVTDVTGFSAATVPVMLAVYGAGMTAGMLVGGRAADRALMPSIYLGLGAIALTLLAVFALVQFKLAAVVLMFLLGFASNALVPALQMRLMNAAADAPSLAAGLNHAALNVANAAGAWLGGAVIAAGYGLTAPSIAGAGLAIVGLGLAGASGLLERRSGPVQAAVETPQPGDESPAEHDEPTPVTAA